MKAVQLTCKKWDNLSKSRSFSKMHIDKAAAAAKEGESRMIMLMDYSLHLMSVNIIENPSLESKGKLTCLKEQVKICNVIHCEGLLLCLLKDDTRIVVWNPYCEQTRWIQPKYPRNMVMQEYWYAFGYVNKKNKSCHSHKILRFLDGCNYEIYDFDSDLWRGINVTPTPKWKSYSEDELNDHIVCFDFTKERFGPLMHLLFSAGHDDYVTLSCVREEKLAVLITHNEINPYEMDIWISTKIEAQKVSWSKFLTLVTKRPNFPFISSSFFIDEEKKVAMGFDGDASNYSHILSILGEDKYFKQLVLGDCVDKISSRFTAQICPYVPSLAQIKQPGGGKRKQQSSLKKCRFVEKPINERYELRSKEKIKRDEKPINERYGLRLRKEKIKRD